MKLNLRGLVAALFAVPAAGLLHCGSSSNLGTPQTGDGGIQPGETPLEHFPAGFSCRATRPAGINTDSGSCDADAGANCTCNADSECTDGKNGRCVVMGNGRPICDYDECFAASDCAGGSSCACGDIYSISSTRIAERTGFAHLRTDRAASSAANMKASTATPRKTPA